MIWDELDPSQSECVYAQCCVCKTYPAFSIIDTRYGDYEGPLCLEHWHDHIDKVFADLSNRLENEDWGSSPETRGEKC